MFTTRNSESKSSTFMKFIRDSRNRSHEIVHMKRKLHDERVHPNHSSLESQAARLANKSVNKN